MASEEKVGSDAFIEFTCTPCGEDNTKQEANTYCPECEEYLCQSCTRHHGRQKATRSHQLLDKDKAGESLYAASAAKCLYHPDRDIEAYCGTHDMVYCLKCISFDHRNGCDVKFIDDALCFSRKEYENQMRNLQKDVIEIKAKLTDTKESKEENIEMVKMQESSSISMVQEIERKLISHIQKLKNDTTQAIQTKSREIEKELQAEIADITKSITEVEKLKIQLEMEKSMNAQQEFIQIKLVKKLLENVKDLDHEIKSRKSKTLCVTENADLCVPVTTALALGNIKATNKQIKPKRLKLLTRKNVRMKDDASSCFIPDICQTQDGSIILVDNNNKKLKKLGGDYDIKETFKLESGLAGICCTGSNKVAVKMANNKIQFLNVGAPFSKLASMAIVEGSLLGVEYDGDDTLFVTFKSGVIIYDVSGTLVQAIVKTPTGQNIFTSKPAHMVVLDRSLIVADRLDGAVQVKKDGTVLKQFRHERLKGVHGICKSEEGIIFLAGKDSGNILMFDEDGQYLGDLVSEGIGSPISLCYHTLKNCIISTSFNSDEICIIELDE